ncbi:hypothetical protein AYL99_08314 [Fonsecaea erecta]|uniref:Uncharacterized protein n=1 Tax=Fonsecaea erecta TaxID=1367422 RepID=A0A178ZDN9_9EURO|nr:hypothetical protein AYL99_08314 [Fonsecaea erecta]OAP57576.1 hypothetical protein AYL99_08314 [Fonsecaea erecta]
MAKADSTKEQIQTVPKQTVSTTTLNITDLESQMEALGVSCWDFAYPTGRCSLPPVKNCCFTSEPKCSSRKARVEHKSKHQERLVAGGATTETVLSALQADPADDRQCSTTTKSRSQHHHHHSSKGHKNSSKHQHRSSNPELRTYLLSCPTVASIIYPQTYTTISTLLLTPQTQLVLLVPQSNIVCPKVCELMRLPRAGSSGIRILPVPAEIEMRAICDEESANGSSLPVSIADVLAVEEVVTKIVKNTPAKAFDGYIAFEDDRAAWTFLDRVGKGVKSASRKA